jgi:hypothetical protein
VLGNLGPVVERLDAASVVDLVGKYDLDRIRMYAALLAEEGTIRELRGQESRAQYCFSRALELYAAISLSGARLKTADWERIASLQPKVAPGTIDGKYHDELLRLSSQNAPRA